MITAHGAYELSTKVNKEKNAEAIAATTGPIRQFFMEDIYKHILAKAEEGETECQRTFGSAYCLNGINQAEMELLCKKGFTVRKDSRGRVEILWGNWADRNFGYWFGKILSWGFISFILFVLGMAIYGHASK
jgi:hypothetical protein